MEIRRFGAGHRRHEGPAGTRGVDGQTIHADEHGVIAELAFRPGAAITPHSNPNLTYFLVIEGGGYVSVGGEVARVAAGEAVVWPANTIHSAWTDQSPMRALVVEFAAGSSGRLLEAGDIAAGAIEAGHVQPGEARPLRPEADPAPDRESKEGEPW